MAVSTNYLAAADVAVIISELGSRESEIMRRKWLIATATGASLSLLSAGAMAQLRTDARGGAESPKVKAVGIPGDTGVPQAKINAPERDGAKTRSRLPDHRTGDDVRRETRRIPAAAVGAVGH